MRRAFTIVELLVVMALVALMAGSGAAISLSAGRKKAVDRAAEDLATAMRQARDFAQAGKKDLSCGQSLDGWQVIVETTRYTVQGKCGSPFGVRQINFLGGVTATNGTGTILFKPLSLGTDLTSSRIITLSVSGFTQKVSITNQGEVKVGP
ncbi:MAG: hypothetical protein UX52_C0007G0005 [Candidatus Amesbacteria bacterium GW2011_GWA1_46_35]|uniref:General secretion pathway GspH domain-containing protein n=1 Tax=Candidatus Amesbacteria bacterium GW2011_GWC2_45_19 TaxID=1618366 RepID=A0A0G1M411_9BACT|nr:MAG: hypothetical protein UX05_C0005G0041 [Candidatus Amesbacteria bacterium GW2011_GWC2_45_19]KKU38352.1 MAG: hypothetical protein UX52_C0007G0005 [Candidatus Amesbacteria bacterium GW2011_GWA1_46_35]KKU68805.1 MAG: hypothetical protein UX93_C0005G0041 [Microgenomates group bacterium GW2011_GWC1_47_20]